MTSPSMLEMFEDEEAGNAWIVTFADMMTLLLVFFILLYTLANFDDQAYRKMVESVQLIDGEGNQVSVIDFATNRGRNPEPIKRVDNLLGMNPASQPLENLNPELVKDLQGLIDSSGIAENLELEFDGDQINLQIDGRLLFQSGEAVLSEAARPVFADLGKMFRRYADYRIAIRGHTDDLEINTLQYPSNWELSAIRATTVLRFFLSQGIDPERMTATGYANSLPLVENISAQNRAKNRRVEFVLEKEKDN